MRSVCDGLWGQSTIHMLTEFYHGLEKVRQWCEEAGVSI